MASSDLVQDTFKYHLILMKLFGIYPFDSCPKFFKPYAFVYYVVFTTIPPILPVIHLIVAKETDLEVITQNSFMMIELLSLILKMLPCKINPEGTKRTIYALNKKIFNDHLPEQEAILVGIVRNCNTVFTVICVDYVAAVIAWGTKPLWYKDRRFPFFVWLPFDPTENTVVYWTVYIYIILGVIHGGTDNATVDTLIANLMYHAAGQVRILKDNLMHLGERADDVVLKEGETMSTKEKEELRAKIIYEKLCRCIDHYDAISELVDDIEKTYSPVIFSQFLASIIIIGICIYHLSVAVLFSAPFFTTMVFTTAILGELFLHCYSGSILFDESNSIVEAIYMSDWYTFDIKSKKALIILMERAKRPMLFTAGKLMDLSLQTFTMVMRRSYSILAVLKNN